MRRLKTLPPRMKAEERRNPWHGWSTWTTLPPKRCAPGQRPFADVTTGRSFRRSPPLRRRGHSAGGRSLRGDQSGCGSCPERQHKAPGLRGGTRTGEMRKLPLCARRVICPGGYSWRKQHHGSGLTAACDSPAAARAAIVLQGAAGGAAAASGAGEPGVSRSSNAMVAARSPAFTPPRAPGPAGGGERA